MIRLFPFGAYSGFSDDNRPGTSYYSQGFTRSFLGAATLYSIQEQKSSDDIGGMGNIKNFASANGVLYAQDDNGNVLAEATPGQYDFSIARSPGGNGAGMMGDQNNRLLYAQNTQIGMYNGSAWTDNWKTGFTSWQHPMDTYEDSIYIGNKSSLAQIDASDNLNLTAFTLPSGMTIDAVRSGPTGILMGANFSYQGAIILWNTNTDRAITPWKWTKGKILAIERFGANWLVVTQREVILTNGYKVQTLWSVFDDPLSFKMYETTSGLVQRITVVNNTVVFLVPPRSSNQSYEYGKQKPGVYLYHLDTKSWDYIPIHTGNTASASATAVFADVNSNRIVLGYRDNKLAKNYIGNLSPTGPTQAQYVSEVIGEGRPHFQRTYFGPTDKVAESVILNLGVLNSEVDPATITFNAALKIYNFKRQLWGHQLTNSAASAGNQIKVDGSSSSYYDAQVGDEVTVLEGANAGKIAHITAITNDGTNTETWTLDTTFANNTENGINMNVMPFVLVEKKVISGVSNLSNINMFFNVKGKVRGKQFLAKVVLDGLGTNLQLESQLSYFVFDDLSYDAT